MKGLSQIAPLLFQKIYKGFELSSSGPGSKSLPCFATWSGSSPKGGCSRASRSVSLLRSFCISCSKVTLCWFIFLSGSGFKPSGCSLLLCSRSCLPLPASGFSFGCFFLKGTGGLLESLFSFVFILKQIKMHST